LEEKAGYTVYTGNANPVSDPFQVCFAAFDVCHIPIIDNAIACISSQGGLSNLAGLTERTGIELARVLRPGGMLVAIEMEFTHNTILCLPNELKESWSTMDPLMAYFCSGGGWTTLLERVGFEIQEDIVFGQRTLRAEDDSGLAKVALQHGITLDVEFHYIVATKPTGPT
jgi:ubiquinone/menaquinone biosynthesis C-methylase UbiE